jgi:hypothetical protein
MVKTRQVLRLSTAADSAEHAVNVATLLAHAEHVKSLTVPQGVFEGLTVNSGPLAVALAEMKLEAPTGSTDIGDVCETIVYGGGHNCTSKDTLTHKVKSAVVVDFARSQFATLSKWHHKWSNLKAAVLSKGWDLSSFDAKRWRGAAAMLEAKDSAEGPLALHTQKRSDRERHVKRIVGQGAEHLEAYLEKAKVADDEFHSRLDETTSDGKRRLESVLVVPGPFVVLILPACCVRCALLVWPCQPCILSRTACTLQRKSSEFTLERRFSIVLL